MESKKQTTKSARGFTLIEVMIAMTIFTVLVTIGIGAVLSAISQHYATEDSRTVTDGISFALEDMARNVRLGYDFRCVTNPSEIEPITSGGTGASTDPIAPQSCLLGTPSSPTSNKIIFNDLKNNHLTYVIPVPAAGTIYSTIYKQEGDDPTQAEMILPPEVKIDFTKSGFTVRGAEAGDGQQPTIVIRLAGTITSRGVTSNFAVQTSVTARGADS